MSRFFRLALLMVVSLSLVYLVYTVITYDFTFPKFGHVVTLTPLQQEELELREQQTAELNDLRDRLHGGEDVEVIEVEIEKVIQKYKVKVEKLRELHKE